MPPAEAPAEAPVEIEEQNGENYFVCPNCSFMHPTMNEKGKALTMPSECQRCTCPMDFEEAHKAHGFSDTQAAAYGKNLKRPQRTTQVRQSQAVTKS